MVRIHYFAVMVTVMQFSQFFFYESQVQELRKAFTKKKSSDNDPFIAVLLLFYDLKYINSIKNRFSNKKLVIVPKVTLISNLKINIVTKFQVSIFNKLAR